MKSAHHSKLLVLLVAPMVFVAFQNCSPVKFQSMEEDGVYIKMNADDLGDGAAPIVESIPEAGETPAPVSTPIVLIPEVKSPIVVVEAPEEGEIPVAVATPKVVETPEEGEIPEAGPTPIVRATPPVVTPGSEEESIEDVVADHKSSCAQLVNDAITYDSIADTNSAAVAVGGTGGTRTENHENISTANYKGGTHTVVARSIDSIDHFGGTGYFNASRINKVKTYGGTTTVIANRITSFDGTGGNLCISAETMPSVIGTGGYMVAQGRSSSASIPEVAEITGGTHAFKDFKIGSIKKFQGGTLILENVKVDSIENASGGTIILINSEVGSISNAYSEILVKNSTIASVQNARDIKVID